MARKEWTEEQRKALGEKLKAARAAKKQTQTETPKQTAPSISPVPGIQFTQEQFDALIQALSSGNRTTAPVTNAFTAGLQTNAQGQIVGTKELYNPDPDYYPNPVDELTTFFESSPRYRQFAFSYNYFLTWEVTSKPYTTKDGFQQREPTFHVTLYATVYNENGEDSGNFRVVQSLELNEDSAAALDYAAGIGIDANESNMKEVMDRARFERIKRWLISVFYTENNYGLNVQTNESVIDGQVVRVITKSNVQGYNAAPKIDVNELQ